MHVSIGTILLIMTTTWSITGQTKSSTIDLYNDLQEFANPITVMYIAAHPDDENTRLISWLSNDQHIRTIYLSLTRGDGGQNLIGTEKGALLGLLRTQELLAARRIDHGEQTFSRANDFGFSKTATETRQFWEEDQILSDVVWAIRTYQPDILINRFDHESNGRTHGHHTFSAIVGLEAFDLAGDPKRFPEQLAYVDVWQPERIFFNTSWWFFGSQEAFDKADKSGFVSLDIGSYLPLEGVSTNEIASLSRSMHRCQGFGSQIARGSQMEYLKYLKGSKPKVENGQMVGLTSNLDVSWEKKSGIKDIDSTIQGIVEAYDLSQPQAIVPQLLRLRQLLKQQETNAFLQSKLRLLEDLILRASGMYMSAYIADEIVTAGDTIPVHLELLNRGDYSISVSNVDYNTTSRGIAASTQTLEPNHLSTIHDTIWLDHTIAISTPYWLEEAPTSIGMYRVDSIPMRGKPENDARLFVSMDVHIEDAVIEVTLPIHYQTVDPSIGEIHLPVVMAPPASVEIADNAILLINEDSREIDVSVSLYTDHIKGLLHLDAPKGWIITPQAIVVDQSYKDGTQNYRFTLHAEEDAASGELLPMIKVGDTHYGKKEIVIDYPHIPKQQFFIDASVPLQRMSINVPDVKVGYIAGAGDEIPEAINRLGLPVDKIPMDALQATPLDSYDVVLVGIRAFNIHESLGHSQHILWDYVHRGGTVIVQYQNNRGLVSDISPIELKLSRLRITDETAALTPIVPDHPLFHTPNEITQADFDHWVQERGLYAAESWDDRFTPLLAGHDPDEEDIEGLLIVAPYGEGIYAYTGLSFFRQLPAGVPGAYRLFANLLALKKADK